MPETRASVLEYKPATDLRPGETGIRLKDDPYYGKVDLGTEPTTPVDAKTREHEKKERARISQLPADQRPAAEKSLKEDLAKRRKEHHAEKDLADPMGVSANESQPELREHLDFLSTAIEDGVHVLSGAEQDHVEVLTGKRLQPRPPAEDPREPKDVTEPIAGKAGADAASRGAALEPPERDRDKTKAAKPGESAKGVPVEPATKPA